MIFALQIIGGVIGVVLVGAFLIYQIAALAFGISERNACLNENEIERQLEISAHEVPTICWPIYITAFTLTGMFKERFGPEYINTRAQKRLTRLARRGR